MHAIFRLFSACLLFSSSSLFAETYAGYVYDGASGIALAGVHVDLIGSPAEAVTDASGHFSLTGIPSGILSENTQIRPMLLSTNGNLFRLPKGLKVRIRNLQGKLLFSQTENSTTGDLATIPPGVHYLEVQQGKEHLATSFTLLNSGLSRSFLINFRSAPLAKKSVIPGKLVFRKDGYYAEDHSYPTETVAIYELMTPNKTPWIFDETAIRKYEITLAKADSQQMADRGLWEEYVPGTLKVDGVNIGSVGVRYKGSTYSIPLCFDNAGYHPENEQRCNKVSLKVKFNLYDSTNRLKGLKKLDLLALYESTALRNMLSYRLFHSIGIPASRTAFAEVYVNGTFWGLHLATENVDGRFTKNWFSPDGNGNVYKEIWPNGRSEAEYLAALKTNENPEDFPDVSDMIAFSDAIAASTPATFATAVAPWLNVDQVVRYMVVDRATWNWDGVTTWYGEFSPHNFYWVREGKSGPFWLIPWDLDNTFSSWGGSMTADWNVLPLDCSPVNDGMYYPPGCDPLLNSVAQTSWDSFVSHGNDFLAGAFSANTVNEKLDRWKILIDPVVTADPTMNSSTWNTSFDEFRNVEIPHWRARFIEHLQEGYVIEQPETGLDDPIDTYAGIELGRSNNFEALQAVNLSHFGISSLPATNTNFYHNTTSPVSGAADMKLDFTFKREDPDPAAVANQWIGLDWEFYTPGQTGVDISAYRELKVDILASKDRYLQVYLLSDAYATQGVSWEKIGWSRMSGTSTTLTFKLSDAAFPAWASNSLPNVQTVVLKSFTGLRFNFGADSDTQGQMSSTSDTGSFQVDNIRFIP